ncbi:PspC domain-containing protein [Intrasporangium sp. YIM S08009]|uniref:PspC domain-containing protein n=1 Tax=Intrasporangium zincisolvens TaxID=3080018 RepID=UPI002B055872|nr:PspC domain-containing protein [Intrasporangium sp. YIM S08009]
MTKSKNAPTQGHGLDGFYDALRRPGITRVADGGWFAGVSTGLGRWLGVDALVVRAGFILLSIFFGMGVAVYLALWLVMPDERGEIHLERALKHGEGRSIFLLVVTAVSLFGGGPWWGGDTHGLRFGAFVLLAVGAWWFLTRTDQGRRLSGWPWTDPGSASSGSSSAASATAASSTPSSPPAPSTGNAAANAGAAMSSGATVAPPRPAPVPRVPRPRTRTIGFAPGLLVLGLAVLAGAVVAEIAHSAGVLGNPFAVGIATGVGVLGLGIVVAGLAGRRAGALAFFTVLGMFAAVVATAAPRGLTQPWQAGDESHVVTSVSDTKDFQLGLGDLHVDLTALDATALKGQTNPVPVKATVGVGQIDLVVPKGVNVQVNAKAKAGALSAVGASGGDVVINTDRTDNGSDMPMRMRSSDGISIDRTVTYGGTGAPAIVVDAEVGIGQINVTTGSAS